MVVQHGDLRQLAEGCECDLLGIQRGDLQTLALVHVPLIKVVRAVLDAHLLTDLQYRENFAMSLIKVRFK